MELALRLVAGVLLIAANGFFVAVEFALTRLPDLEIDPDDVDSPGLERALSMLDRLEIHLTGCQLGISTTSVLLGVVAEPAITTLIEPAVGLVGVTGGSVHGISVVVAVVLLNLVHKIWGEQAPTYLGVERPREVARRLAPILWWWSKTMHPVIKLGDGLAKWTLGLIGVEITRSWTEVESEVESEVSETAPSGGAGSEGAGSGAERAPPGRRELKRKMAELLSSSDELPEDRQQEVLQALEIDELPVRDVMVPTEEVVFLAVGAGTEETLERLARTGFVRYPVLADEAEKGDVRRGDVVGVLYVPRLFDPPTRLRADELRLDEVVDEPVFVDADVPVAAFIDRLQEVGHEVAMVVEGDEVRGMATVTDALEAIAGEVRDPLDRA